MYQLPSLPYAFNDLEPYYDEETLKLHYEVLYKKYLDNLNNTLKKLNETREKSDYTNIKCLERDLSFNGAGFILHTLFFYNITPNETKPSGELESRIIKDFGSIQSFIDQFANSIVNIDGSGWGILGYSKILNKLIILQCEKHENLTIWDFEPILVIDIWEHSYYLQYKTDKKMYINNILQIINWDEVARRYKKLLF